MHITAALEGIFGSVPPDPQPGMIYYTSNTNDGELDVDFYKIIARSDDEVTVRRLNDRRGPNGFYPVGNVFGSSIKTRLGNPGPDLFMVDGARVTFWNNQPVLS